MKVAVTLRDNHVERHDYVETASTHDGTLVLKVGREKWVHYSLTAIIKWEAEV